MGKCILAGHSSEAGSYAGLVTPSTSQSKTALIPFQPKAVLFKISGKEGTGLAVQGDSACIITSSFTVNVSLNGNTLTASISASSWNEAEVAFVAL